jgi:hypothetical protein
MPVHDWTVVDAGIFHHFHQRWIAALTDVLNERVLPQEYYVLAELQGGRFEGGSASIGDTTLGVELSAEFTPANGAQYETIETSAGVTGLFTDSVTLTGTSPSRRRSALTATTSIPRSPGPRCPSRRLSFCWAWAPWGPGHSSPPAGGGPPAISSRIADLAIPPSERGVLEERTG